MEDLTRLQNLERQVGELRAVISQQIPILQEEFSTLRDQFAGLSQTTYALSRRNDDLAFNARLQILEGKINRLDK